MSIPVIALSKLKAAPYNPKDRANEKKTRMLQYSVEKIGLQYPILLNKKYEIIDGHRRVSVYKTLGIKYIPYLISANDNTDEVYAEVNANSKPLSGNQTLQVWLKNERAVTSKSRSLFGMYEKLIGRPIMQTLSDKGFSIHLVRIARAATKYVGKDQDDAVYIRRTVVWLAKHRNQHLVRAYIELNQSPKILYNAIQNGRDVSMTFVEGKAK